MIFSENKKTSMQLFRDLMSATDNLLNSDAKKREDYYCSRKAKLLENDVYEAMKECSQGTPFQGTIQLVSGSQFPDIVAGSFYGVEVKSTEKDHWTSTGSSILESTRIQNVEKIFLTFGKLGKPVRFLTRPYEECMSDIAVTHYPRYKIDMRLGIGETIFDKIGIPYDDLRQMENPVIPVSNYYKAQLKKGESLWWASSEHQEESALPPTVRIWSSLSKEEKEYYKVQGCALFLEIFNSQYNRYALWLVTQKGIVNTNIRDSFSSGGQVPLKTIGGIEIKMPAIFGRVKQFRNLIIETITDCDEEILKEYWRIDTIENNRIKQWCHLVAKEVSKGLNYTTIWSILCDIFPEIS